MPLNKKVVTIAFSIVGILGASDASFAQPAISIQGSQVFLAGKVQVGWSTHDLDLKTKLFTFTELGTIKKGQTIPVQMSDTQAWSVRTVPLTIGHRVVHYPLVAMIKVSKKGGALIIPGLVKINGDIQAGKVLQSPGTLLSFRVVSAQSVKAGDVIPVLRIGDWAIFSIEPMGNSKSESTPSFSAIADKGAELTSLKCWRIERGHSEPAE